MAILGCKRAGSNADPDIPELLDQANIYLSPPAFDQTMYGTEYQGVLTAVEPGTLVDWEWGQWVKDAVYSGTLAFAFVPRLINIMFGMPTFPLLPGETIRRQKVRLRKAAGDDSAGFDGEVTYAGVGQTCTLTVHYWDTAKALDYTQTRTCYGDGSTMSINIMLKYCYLYCPDRTPELLWNTTELITTFPWIECSGSWLAPFEVSWTDVYAN